MTTSTARRSWAFCRKCGKDARGVKVGEGFTNDSDEGWQTVSRGSRKSVGRQQSHTKSEAPSWKEINKLKKQIEELTKGTIPAARAGAGQPAGEDSPAESERDDELRKIIKRDEQQLAVVQKWAKDDPGNVLAAEMQTRLTSSLEASRRQLAANKPPEAQALKLVRDLAKIKADIGSQSEAIAAAEQKLAEDKSKLASLHSKKLEAETRLAELRISGVSLVLAPATGEGVPLAGALQKALTSEGVSEEVAKRIQDMVCKQLHAVGKQQLQQQQQQLQQQQQQHHQLQPQSAGSDGMQVEKPGAQAAPVPAAKGEAKRAAVEKVEEHDLSNPEFIAFCKDVVDGGKVEQELKENRERFAYGLWKNSKSRGSAPD